MGHEITVSIGPAWMRKIIVVSHERSGTHFLMNTIADNFGYLSYPWIDMDMNQPVNWWSAENLLSFLMTMKDVPVANLIKSHHQVDFFLPVLEPILEEFHLFYIYRDHEATLESFSKHLGSFPWNAGPRVNSGKELAIQKPCGSMLRYQMIQYETVYDRLVEHQKGWMKRVPLRLIEKIIYIDFDDLANKFDKTVAQIAHRIGVPIPDRIVKPDKEDRVVTPNGRWIEPEEKEIANG